ncbi:MAG: hypothetical protein Tsb0021_01920 [Chlamydiales bacterium]
MSISTIYQSSGTLLHGASEVLNPDVKETWNEISRLGIYTLTYMISTSKEISPACYSTLEFFKAINSAYDLTRWIGDYTYFFPQQVRLSERNYATNIPIQNDFRGRKYTKILSHVLLASTLDIVGPLLFLKKIGALQEIDFINLTKISSTIGNVCIFGKKPLEFIASATLSQAASICLIISMSGFAINHVWNLMQLFEFVPEEHMDSDILQLVRSRNENQQTGTNPAHHPEFRYRAYSEIAKLAGTIAEIALQVFALCVGPAGASLAGVCKTTLGVMIHVYHTNTVRTLYFKHRE